jgi:hypothetical protein
MHVSSPLRAGLALASLVCLPLFPASAQDSKSTLDAETVPPALAEKPWTFDGAEAQSAYKESIQQALRDKKFQELEDLAAELRAGQGLRFTDGRWKLAAFYDTTSKEKDILERLALLDEWKKAMPKSIAEPVARANLMTDYAWVARGSGYANTVTEIGWKLMHERLETAREVLLETKERSSVDPQWYATMQWVALAQAWPRADFDALCEEAVKRHPAYTVLYAQRYNYLLPKWHGNPGEAAAYAKKVAQDVGAETYTRIIWTWEFGHLNAYYADPGADKELLWKGWEEMMARYPDSSWNLNAYAFFAVAARDKERAKGIFEKIDKKWTPGIWEDWKQFDRSKDWANGVDRKKKKKEADKAEDAGTAQP